MSERDSERKREGGASERGNEGGQELVATQHVGELAEEVGHRVDDEEMHVAVAA